MIKFQFKRKYAQNCGNETPVVIASRPFCCAIQIRQKITILSHRRNEDWGVHADECRNVNDDARVQQRMMALVYIFFANYELIVFTRSRVSVFRHTRLHNASAIAHRREAATNQPPPTSSAHRRICAIASSHFEPQFAHANAVSLCVVHR